MDLATEDGRALQERLARVERQVRWTTAMATVLALLCAVILAWQFVPHDQVVDASAFVLRDRSWRARGELVIRSDGSPMLRLNNLYGRARAVFHLRDDGVVVLRMMDVAGTTRALLSLDGKGQPSLVMSGPDSSARVTLLAAETDEAGAPRVELRDRLGRTVWSAPAGAAPRNQAARSR
jgi:hypothetical protein